MQDASETTTASAEAFEPAAEPTTADLPADDLTAALTEEPAAAPPPAPASLASDPDDELEPTDAQGLPTF